MGLRQYCDAWVLQVGLSRWIILSNPAANVGQVNPFLLHLSVSSCCVVLTGLGRKSTEIMAAICKGFSLFHCLSLLAEAALIAEQGFSSRGLTSRAACSWSLIPWFVTLEQQGQGRRGNTYPTVVAVRMAEWPEGSRHRSCSQLYFLLHVSCGHLTKSFLGLMVVS